jgi:AraC-like DNA-binding protein
MIQLAGEASVTEAAHRCGWATTSAFIDTFRRAMGQTPGSYKAAAPAPAPTAGDSSRSSRRLIPAALSSAGSVGYSI